MKIIIQSRQEFRFGGCSDRFVFVSYLSLDLLPVGLQLVPGLGSDANVPGQEIRWSATFSLMMYQLTAVDRVSTKCFRLEVEVIEFDFRPCWPPEDASSARTPRGGAHSPICNQSSKVKTLLALATPFLLTTQLLT